MERDGFNESVWQTGRPGYIARAEAISGGVYDVLIVGGGITGITTAYMMQKAGLRCLVAESRTLCFGTTGGTTAHLNNFFDSTYAQFQKSFGEENAALLAQTANQALDLYRSNVNELNLDCDYVENEGCLFSVDEKQAKQLEDVLKASKKAGIAVRETNQNPVPIPFTRAIVYEKQAQINPVNYVFGLAMAFENSGGVILQHCRVTGIGAAEKGENNGVLTVETSLGQVRSKNVVYATHIPPGVNLLHFKCSPWRSYVLACRLENEADYPNNPAYDMADPYHYYRTQLIDGKKYLIAGGEDHATGREEDTDAPFQRLEKYISQYFRISEVSRKWSSQYFDPADGLAYIGHLPGAPENVFVGCGFAGNGMTYSHIAAGLFLDLVRGKHTAVSELFSPARLKPITALGNEIASGASVAASFIADRFKIKKIVDASELDRGEARLVKQDGEQLAIYRDERGKFHTVSPTCTHLACLVHWNKSERSWDCPCHGARYNIDGEMITGPADRDLPLHSPAF